MSSQQKRGFRLPWGAERDSEAGAAAAATLDPATSDSTSDVESDDPGEAPFRPAGSSPTLTTEAAPAASDVRENTAEAAMIETQKTAESSGPESGTEPTAKAGAPAKGSEWPDVDRRTSPNHAADAARPAARSASAGSVGASTPRRENPLVAGLVKAMREAAVASRDETLLRLMGEAETRVESIRSRATEETAELKRRAETDIAEIREWSKAEIARVRQKTEDRIDTRKTELSGETERHAASVERLVGDVQSVVASFESEMEEFFGRLLAENDPARLAALAEQAPDPPDLTGDGPAAIDLLDAPAREVPSSTPGLEADAAAAAEVAATEGLDLGSAGDWPAAVQAGARRADAGAAEGEDAGSTRLTVTGLASVAGISAFKGALGQLAGVQNVSVTSGERGAFQFAVVHEPGFDLAAGLAGLADFGARVTDAKNGNLDVVAHEPTAA